jgi:hypothetical protein
MPIHTGTSWCWGGTCRSSDAAADALLAVDALPDGTVALGFGAAICGFNPNEPQLTNSPRVQTIMFWVPSLASFRDTRGHHAGSESFELNKRKSVSGDMGSREYR